MLEERQVRGPCQAGRLTHYEGVAGTSPASPRSAGRRTETALKGRAGESEGGQRGKGVQDEGVAGRDGGETAESGAVAGESSAGKEKEGTR